MNGFKIKKIQSLTLGERMRRARNEKRIGLPEIAKNTKIQLEYLEYLESGDYGKLPADVYVRGFLKSYADYLGINDEYLIKSFNKEKSIQENIKGGNQEIKYAQKINLNKFSITPKLIYIFFISLFFLVLAFYLYKNLNNFVANPELIILNPLSEAVITDTKVLVKGRTDVGNTLFINNQPVLVDDQGIFSENIVLREGRNVITVRSINQFNKEITRSISVEAQYEERSQIEEVKPPENVEAPVVEEAQVDASITKTTELESSPTEVTPPVADTKKKKD
ncbi:MAG: helix-turn-helix domain-containing protein [Candidatus Moraniibacteriota bacterium]